MASHEFMLHFLPVRRNSKTILNQEGQRACSLARHQLLNINAKCKAGGLPDIIILFFNTGFWMKLREHRWFDSAGIGN